MDNIVPFAFVKHLWAEFIKDFIRSSQHTHIAKCINERLKPRILHPQRCGLKTHTILCYHHDLFGVEKLQGDAPQTDPVPKSL